MSLWDSYQLRAYGRADVAPLLDSNGRGNAPWGLANVVAGPQSGYAWEFDAAAYESTSGTTTQKIQAAIKLGPWNRVKYPGSQISSDQPGLVSNALGQAGIDASLIGIEPDAIPANTTAVRFAIGQLELGRPEYSAVKLRVNLAPSTGGCQIMYADAFGGDAGGTEGGKDHMWRYFDPTVVSLNPCAFLQKVVSKSLVAPGETFYYDITFANNGTVALPDFKITDVLPTGLAHVSATPTQTTLSGQILTWNFGTVNPGDFITIRHYVRANGTGTLFNTATALSGAGVVGVAQTSVEVGTRSILNKSKTVTPSSTAPGGTVTYTLNIENLGTGLNGMPLRVRDFLPPGFTYVSLQSATLNGAAISSPTIAVDASNSAQPVFTIGQGIQPGKKLVINFTALVGAGVGPGTYYNYYQLEYEGKIIPPIPEAPVTVGGARIGDTVFRDWDGDGTQDAGELGMQGVTVTLLRDADNNGSFETTVGTRTTDASGNYLFTGLAAGSYQVSVPAAGSGGVPTGYTLTADPNGAPISSTFDVSLAASQSVLTADFGYRPAGTGTIGDQVFEDSNKNGVWNAGEPGIPNVTVRLYADNNTDGIIDGGDLLVTSTATNGAGVYGFGSLDTSRKYLVQVDDSDADIAAYFNGLYGSGANQLISSNPFVVNSGFTAVTTADFGFWRALPASIGDQVFVDNNQNGTYDAGDAPLGSVTVNLFAADGVTLVATTTSDVSGNYLFNGVAAGTYVVRVDTTDNDIPSGYSASVLSFNPTVAAGASFLTADFPFISVFNKAVNKASATPGELLNYTMTPFWPGPSLLTNATVTDAIPAGTTFASAGQGGALGGLTGAVGVPGSHPGQVAGTFSTTFTSTADNEIWSQNPTANYGSELVAWVARTNTYRDRVLLQFDLGTIPSNATVSSAVMTLNRKSGSGGQAVSAHRLTQMWTEVASTWNNRSTGVPWTTPSGDSDYDPTAAATTNVGANGNHNWTITSLVQNWVNSTHPNYGLIMRLQNEGANGEHEFRTKEDTTPANRPRLAVNYTTPAIPSTTTAISVSPSSVLDSGSGVNVTVSMAITASGAVGNIIPSALTVIPGSNGATANLVSGPTNSPASIGSGGGSATFTWVYKVLKGSAEDQVRFSGNATGTGATFNSATSNGVVVKDAAAASSVIWNLGSNSAAINGSHSGTSGSVNTTITSAKSTWNYEDRATSNYGADPAIVVESNSPFRARGFVEFDLASIPAGATINSASLRLVHSNLTNAFGDTEAGSPFTVGVRRLTRGWVEGTALGTTQAGSLTWSSAGPANWTTAGGDFAATDYGSFTGGASDALGTVYSVNVQTLVNEWYQGTQTNQGLILTPLTNPGGGDHFFSVFSDDATNVANRPQLLVTYTPAATSATTTAFSVSPVLVTDSGSGRNVNVSMTVAATGAVTNITPPTNLTVAGTNGATATRISGPTASPASIGSGGGSATFTWVYQVTAGSTPGQVTFTGTPTGTGATFGAATSHGVIVTPPLTMSVTVNTPPGVNLVDNIAEFYNGPTFLASDNAITSLTGSIGDYVWADTDADGVQDSGEFGVPGVTVQLYAADGVTLLLSAITDSSGLHRFYGLAAGNYVVRYDDTTTPSGYFGSTPSSVSVSLAASQQFNNADFGLAPIPAGTGSIGDYVWIDANNDGVQDSGELPLADVMVNLERLINGNWTVVGTATTGADGMYNFTGLSAASYHVTVDATSQISSPYAQGTFALGDVMAPTHDRDGIVTPHVALVTLATNSTVVTNADFGYNWTGSIGDKVWWDYDTDGLQDEAPLVGVPNARVQLYFDKDFDGVFDRILGDHEILRVFTDSNGNYTIPNLPPGNYFVDVYEDSITTNGLRNVVPTTADIVPVNLIPASMNVTSADFGYYEGARAEATIFWDENHNGIRDGGESLLSGLTVTLMGIDSLGGPVSRTAATDTNGRVAFLIPEGSYTISYNLAQVAGVYPGLGTSTTFTSFDFAAVAGEDGVRRFDFGVDNTGSIGDTIYADSDSNGSQGAPEPGLAGVTVNLYLDTNGDGNIDYGVGDLLIETTLTDGTGAYRFVGLADTIGFQRYVVETLTSTLPSGYQTVPTGYAAGTNTTTSRYSTVLTGAQVISTVDFGYPQVSATYHSISGIIYNDNGAGGGVASNGTQNGTEPGLQSVSVSVEVDSDANGLFDQTYAISTNAAGFYSLSGILEGANIRITVNQSSLPSTAFVQTGDPDGPTLSNVWDIANIQADANDLDFGYVESLGSITGTIVVGNGNGIADLGEAPVGNTLVTLIWAGLDGFPGTSDDVASTINADGNGSYAFNDLRPGLYEITSATSSPYLTLADRDGANPNSINVNLAIGENVVGRDFEYQSATLSGVIWMDTNGDTIRDGGEPLLQNVTVFLDLDSNAVFDSGEPTTVTNILGFYEFTGLVSGLYPVRVNTTDLPVGSVPSFDRDGIVSPSIASVTLVTNQVVADVDFGYYQPGTITGTVLADIDNDDDGDAPLSGVIVTLKDSSGSDIDSDPITLGIQPTATTTPINGTYSFGGLPPGIYRVIETDPMGYSSVTPNEVNPVTVMAGNTTSGVDFVDEQFGRIRGSVHRDDNNDDRGDVSLPGVTVTLYTDPNGDGDPADGAPLDDPFQAGIQPYAQVSDTFGDYDFQMIAPSSYVIVQGQPAGHLSAADLDDIADAPGSPADATNISAIDNIIPVTLAAGETDEGNRFIEELPAAMGNLVWNDIDGNGLKGPAESGIDGVIVELLDGTGAPIDSEPMTSGLQPTTRTTAGGGLYVFSNLAPGSYMMRIAVPPLAYFQASTPVVSLDNGVDDDSNGSQSNPGGSVTSPVIALEPNETDNTVDFGLKALVGTYSIGGEVRDDYDLDGNFSDNDQPVANVNVELYIDSDGSGTFDPGFDTLLRATVTNGLGQYQFSSLPNGTYFVREIDPSPSNSTADTDGPNDNLIKVTISGSNSTGNDFLDAVDPAGYIYSPVDGRIIAGGSISVSGPGSVTILQDASTGQYSFVTDGTPGTYSISYTPPLGYLIDPTRPVAGPSFDPTGLSNPHTLGSSESTSNQGYLTNFSAVGNPYYFTFDLAPGDPFVINNNIPLVEIKPTTFASWQYANPLGGQNGPTQDPDGDGLTNLEEFAFCYQPNSGVATSCPLRIVRNGDGTLDAEVRRVSGITGVTYTLEYIADLTASGANGAGWTDVTTISPVVGTPIGGVEIANYRDLAQIPAISGGKGYVRVKVSDGVNTVRTYAAGWGTKVMPVGCQSGGQPYLKCAIFSGGVDVVAGSVLDITTSAGGSSLVGQFVVGAQYYVEVTSGDNAGHRWDVLEASTTATSIAIDTASPGNTKTTVPANLSGDSIVLRQHLTFAEAYPPASFTGHTDPALADRLLFFDRTVGAFRVFWLFNGSTKRWVAAGDAFLTNRNNDVLDPCAGHFVHPKTNSVIQVYTGEIRENAFACPLMTGNNLITGGWPIDLSPAQMAMTNASGFTGNRDPAKSDRLHLWVGDTVPGTEGYDTHFYLVRGALNQWTTSANANIVNENNVSFLKAHGGFSLQMISPVDWVIPRPWTP